MRTDFSQRFTLQYPMMDDNRRNHPKVMNKNDSQSLDVEDIVSLRVGVVAVDMDACASAILGASAQLSTAPILEVSSV